MRIRQVLSKLRILASGIYSRGMDRPKGAAYESGQQKGAETTMGKGFMIPSFNEEIYLLANPDVAIKVENGELASGLDHFTAFGIKEKRISAMPDDFDEGYYLATNPAAEAAVSAGEYKSAVHHWILRGRHDKLQFAPPAKSTVAPSPSNQSRKTNQMPAALDSLPEVTIPLPSGDLIYLVNGHRDPANFAVSRRAAAINTINLLKEAGLDIHAFKSILDWGCGCGRVLAGWQGILAPDVKLRGVDVNKELLDFSKENIPYAECIVSSYDPPLPFDSGSIDFSYACSVLTHLTRKAAFEWGKEFGRIISPGGTIMMSYHGSYFAKVVADLSVPGSAELEETGFFMYLHDTGEKNVWLGHNNYATFMTSAFVREIFPDFDMVKIYPGVSRGPNPFAAWQDIIILRRR